MVKIVLKLLLLALLFFAINIPINGFLPFYWGDEALTEKVTNLESRSDEFNTVFLGTSRFARNFSPTVFDSLTSNATHTFNLGVAGLPPIQGFLLSNQIMGMDDLNLKYMFVELTEVNNISFTNLHTTKFKYWYTPDFTKFLVKSVLATEPIHKKVIYPGIHAMTLAEAMGNIGMGEEIVRYWLGQQPRLGVSGPYNNGFQPFDVDASNDPDSVQIKLHQKFLDDPSILATRTVECENGLAKPGPVDGVQLAYAMSLIEQAQEKGIKLIFVLSPRVGAAYSQILPVFNGLPVENRIDLSSPAKYPEFYDPVYSWDVGHLNQAGAVIFSEKLAEEFNQL